MQLYLISQFENCEIDTYHSAVVVAKDSAAAREIDPRSGLPMAAEDWKDPYSHWASDPKFVIVQHLGAADSSVSPGLILSRVRHH